MEKLQRPNSNVDAQVADLIVEMFHSSTKIHICHLSITGVGSYAAHKALDDYYNEIIDLGDSVAEQYQGEIQKILPYPSSVAIPDMKTAEQAINYLRSLKEKVNNLQPQIKFSEIVNQLDEVKSLISGTLYKLTFLK